MVPRGSGAFPSAAQVPSADRSEVGSVSRMRCRANASIPELCQKALALPHENPPVRLDFVYQERPCRGTLRVGGAAQ